MVKEIRKNKFNIGVVLLLNATATSNLISLMLNKNMSRLSDLFMFAAFICLLDFRALSQGTLYRKRQAFYACFFVTLLILVTSILAGAAFSGTFGAVIYNLFPVAIMYALMTDREWENRESFVKIVYYFCGSLTIIMAIVFTKGFTDFSFRLVTITQEGVGIIVDRLTIINGTFYFLLAALAYETNKKHEELFKIIACVCSFLCIVITNRRGKIVELFVCVLFLCIQFLLYGHKRPSVRKMMKIVAGILALGMVLCFVLQNEWMRYQIGRVFGSIRRAIFTLLGSESVQVDASAISRVQVRKGIIGEYDQYSIFQILFGRGYMYKYLDFPILQAFIDLGLVGGCVYAFVQILLPLRYLFRKPRNSTEKFFQMCLIFGLIDLFFNGIPYGWDKFLVLILAIQLFDEEALCRNIAEVA